MTKAQPGMEKSKIISSEKWSFRTGHQIPKWFLSKSISLFFSFPKLSNKECIIEGCCGWLPSLLGKEPSLLQKVFGGAKGESGIDRGEAQAASEEREFGHRTWGLARSLPTAVMEFGFTSMLSMGTEENVDKCKPCVFIELLCQPWEFRRGSRGKIGGCLFPRLCERRSRETKNHIILRQVCQIHQQHSSSIPKTKLRSGENRRA